MPTTAATRAAGAAARRLPPVLAVAVRSQEMAEDAHRVQFIATAQWAADHPCLAADDAAGEWLEGTEQLLPIAGPGAAYVAESAVAELTAALGMGFEAGQRYVGAAHEARSRLPLTWARMVRGEVPAWRVKRIAEHTRLHPQLIATAIDQRIAPVAHTIGPVALEKTVTAIATARQAAVIDQIATQTGASPQEIEEALAEAIPDPLSADYKHVTFEHGRPTVIETGTVEVTATLDAADALHLDHAITDLAREYARLGSSDSLGARRAQALGELARREHTLDYDTGQIHTTRAKRQLVLYVHLNLADAAVSSQVTAPGQVMEQHGMLENTRTPIPTEAVRRWAADLDTDVTIKPVIDTTAVQHAHGYQPPDSMREQVILRDRTCLFPYCQRPARACDLDHRTPWHHGGTTSTDNLGALCRRHHRWKTHLGWTYQPAPPDPGNATPPDGYVWTSPHGLRYLRTPTGTTQLDTPADP